MTTSLVQALTDIKTKLNDLIVEIDVLLGASLMVDDSLSTNATGTPPQKKKRARKPKSVEVVDESTSPLVDAPDSPPAPPAKKKRTPKTKAAPASTDEPTKEETKAPKRKGRKTTVSKVLNL